MDLEESLIALEKVLKYSAKISTLPGLTAEVGGYVGEKLKQNDIRNMPNPENVPQEDLMQLQRFGDYPSHIRDREWGKTWSDEHPMRENKLPVKPKTY